MPTATIAMPARFSPPRSYAQIKKLVLKSSEITRLDPDTTFVFDDARLRGMARGRRFLAELSVGGAGPHTAVRIKLELPWLLGPLLGEVKSEVEKRLAAEVGVRKKRRRS